MLVRVKMHKKLRNVTSLDQKSVGFVVEPILEQIVSRMYFDPGHVDRLVKRVHKSAEDYRTRTNETNQANKKRKLQRQQQRQPPAEDEEQAEEAEEAGRAQAQVGFCRFAWCVVAGHSSAIRPFGHSIRPLGHSATLSIAQPLRVVPLVCLLSAVARLLAPFGQLLQPAPICNALEQLSAELS